MMNTLTNQQDEWEVVKIPEVLFFQEGPGVRKWQFHNTGVKLLNVGNINGGKINLSTTKIHLSEEEAYGKYWFFNAFMRYLTLPHIQQITKHTHRVALRSEIFSI